MSYCLPHIVKHAALLCTIISQGRKGAVIMMCNRIKSCYVSYQNIVLCFSVVSSVVFVLDVVYLCFKLLTISR